jgi:tRNA (adenine22-N1)-methyltransferase
MRSISLGERLRAAAKFVRQDAVFADIGTDHAYLPIFLLTEGIVSRAICSDINQGPLNTARTNAISYGVLDKIELVLTDGAESLKDKGITDVAICGMGGELIARIISDAPFLKSKGIRLILEPMSRQAHLRAFLAESGFATVAEEYLTDSGKSYVCIVAEYDGVKKQLSFAEAEIGAIEKVTGSAASKIKYFTEKRSAFAKSKEGKRAGNLPYDQEEEILLKIDEILNKGNI